MFIAVPKIRILSKSICLACKVSIEQELEYLRSFIGLQKLRMKDNLALHVHLDPRLKDQKIYPLLLIPLVENAFKYAGGAYWINIEAKLHEEENLLFKLANAIPSSESKRKEGGIGLENLKRRLEILYPGKHNYRISRTEDSFEVMLQIILDQEGRRTGDKTFLINSEA